MGSQFFTAVGAFVGTFLGIWIAETSGTGKGVVLKEGQGLFGSSVAGGDLVIPMTAGGVSFFPMSRRSLYIGFLYIASVSVIPELLAESRSGTQALKEVSLMKGDELSLTIKYAAMAFGVFCMVSLPLRCS